MTYMKHPVYKGAGNHSVRELEQLCEDFNEYCYQQQLLKQQLSDSLTQAKRETAALEAELESWKGIVTKLRR